MMVSKGIVLLVMALATVIFILLLTGHSGFAQRFGPWLFGAIILLWLSKHIKLKE